jgi:hypothetical protein
MMDLRTKKNKENGSQEVTGHKTGEQKFFGKWLGIFSNSRQEFLHFRVFTDNWIIV